MIPTRLGSYGSTAGYGAAGADPRPWYSIPLSEWVTGPTANTAVQKAQYTTGPAVPAANYTWVGDFTDVERTYAYRVWSHNVYPVAFQIIQGPPGTSLGKWVKVDAGAPWSAIRSMYQRVTPAKKQIPQMIVGAGQAGYAPGSNAVVVQGGSTLPGLGQGGGQVLDLTRGDDAGAGAGEPSGVGLGQVLGVGAAVTAAVLALYWAFGSK